MDETLFDAPSRPVYVRPRGKIRDAVEHDLTKAGAELLSESGQEALRSAADQLDALDAYLRGPGVRPRDWTHYALLLGQFDATSVRVLGDDASASDAFADALSDFRAAEVRDAARPLPAN